MKVVSSLFPVFTATSLLLALSACQGPEAPTAGSDAAAPGNSQILFSEKFSDKGVFQIVNDGSGNLGSSIQAPIGSEAEKMIADNAGKPTLADVYLALHGSTGEVPEAVARASAQIEGQKALTAATVEAIPDAPPLAKAASLNDFNNAICHDIIEGTNRWINTGCTWFPSQNYLEVPFVSTGMRIFGWNANPWTATMSLLGQTSADPSPNTWKPTIPPYTFSWVIWGGTYSSARARLTLPSGKTGELGMTRHVLSVRIN